MSGYVNGKVEIWYRDTPPANLNILWQKRIVTNGVESTVMYEFNRELSTWQVHNKIELDKKLDSDGVGDIINSNISDFSPSNHNHNLSDLSEKSYNSLDDKPNIPSIDGLATVEQVNLISNGLLHQGEVDTFNDISIQFPNPIVLWAVMVRDEGLIYSYNGVSWKSTGLTAFPYDVAIKDDFVPINQKFTKTIDFVWTSGKYISIDGVVDDESYECTLDYYPVTSGQKFQCNIESTGVGDIVAIYDTNRQLLDSASGVNFELTINQDGYVRFSNRKLNHVNHDIYIIDDSYKSVEEITSSLDSLLLLTPNVQYDLPLVWTDGKYITVNGVGDDANYQGTLDYYKVFAGQKLQCNIFVSGSSDVVALYDENKAFVESKSGTNFEINIEYDGFIRFSNYKVSVSNPIVTNVSEKYIELVSMLNILSSLPINISNKDSFNRIAKSNELFTFVPSTPNIDLKYLGQLDNTKRYLSVSFDDFRSSDFSWVIPLFNKYGFKSTFNRVNSGIPSDLDLSKYSAVMNFGHEIGDHTITHQMYPYYSPLFNGQNPLAIDGGQVEFPLNDDMRIDRGDGKNVFGKTVTDIVDMGYGAPVFESSWADLSDIECQEIRDSFSLYKDVSLLGLLDSLSNDLLGTTGSSFGSWVTNRYTGGIFTDCKTSQNHEVWERICLIQFLYYKKYFGMNFDFAQWSLPGSKNSYLYFEDGGLYYYDREKTQLANDLGKVQSSCITDNAGNLKTRSWIDVLREFGYKLTHDSLFPGRSDGSSITEFSRHLIINSSLSKKDALIYPTERTIPWYDYTAYDEAFFIGESNYAEKMYNHRVPGESAFYNAIENIRNKTANGIIAGCVWDSLDVFSEKIYWEEILRYCKSSGIEVVTKSQAFDIAFNHKLQNGNLIYNPELKNTALEFMPNAITSNIPDGYYGDCSSEIDINTNENVLHAYYVSNNCYYMHYGIPNGNIEFSCTAKGVGNIWIFAIRNNTNTGGESDLLGSIAINETNYSNKNISFFVRNESIEEYNGVNEGYGSKICGIKIVYNGDIFIKNISLIKN